MKTYHDPRFLKAISAHDKAWENPTPIVNSVLGQNHPPGYCTTIDDPDVDGIVIHPVDDYQGLSCAIVLARTMTMGKMMDVIDGVGEVYLFCDLTMRVKRWFVVEHAFLLVGVVEQDINKTHPRPKPKVLRLMTNEGSSPRQSRAPHPRKTPLCVQ